MTSQSGVDLPAFQEPVVEAAFMAFPDETRSGLFTLRGLIFEVAADLPEIGNLQETLKWGQPAYLTPQTRSASTIRLGTPKNGGYALYAHCQTSLIADFRALFPQSFEFEGNRAVLFKAGQLPDLPPLRLLVKAALTYHRKA